MMNRKSKDWLHRSILYEDKGMTLVEILVVLALFTVVFAISSISLSGLIPKTNLSEYQQMFVSDLKRQQMQAMQGNYSNLDEALPQGVYLGDDQYVLFQGDTFQASDSANVVATLPQDVRFREVTIPDRQIIFLPLSGEVMNYQSDLDTFSLENSTTGDRVDFEINQLGAMHAQKN